MNNEKAINQQVEEDNSKISLTNILFAIRSHLIFIIIVTLLFAAGGVGYSKIRKPIYTASVPVQFDVVIKETDEHGEETEKDNQVASTNYLFRYIESAVVICESGEVIDRANVYYNYYLTSGKGIDEFVNELAALYKPVKTSHGEIPGYEVTVEQMDVYRNRWFNSGKVGTRYSSSEKTTVVDFALWVTDLDGVRAREMTRIYMLAADVALNKILIFETGDLNDKGVAGIIDLAGSVAGVSSYSDVVVSRIVLIAAALGVLIALMSIYIMYLLDNTVKSKEQLEEISGASVVAYIDDVAEVK